MVPKEGIKGCVPRSTQARNRFDSKKACSSADLLNAWSRWWSWTLREEGEAAAAKTKFGGEMPFSDEFCCCLDCRFFWLLPLFSCTCNWRRLNELLLFIRDGPLFEARAWELKWTDIGTCSISIRFGLWSCCRAVFTGIGLDSCTAMPFAVIGLKELALKGTLKFWFQLFWLEDGDERELKAFFGNLLLACALAFAWRIKGASFSFFRSSSVTRNSLMILNFGFSPFCCCWSFSLYILTLLTVLLGILFNGTLNILMLWGLIFIECLLFGLDCPGLGSRNLLMYSLIISL